MAELTKDEQIELLTAALLWYAAQSYTVDTDFGDVERYDIGATARDVLMAMGGESAVQAGRLARYQWLRCNYSLTDEQSQEYELIRPISESMVEIAKNVLCDAGVFIDDEYLS